MKKLLIMFSVLVAFCMTACAQGNSKNKDMDMKTLVVYFSATRTTEDVANKIASVTGGEIMAIEPVQPYTSADLDWNDRNSRSSVEMNDPESRPQIKPAAKSISDYDVVFIGYLAPTVVNTFIESNDLNGKTVIPFATSGGSGIRNSVSSLKSSYPEINWKEGKLLNRTSEKAITEWIESLAL
jgi:flavodoxin